MINLGERLALNLGDLTIRQTKEHIDGEVGMVLVREATPIAVSSISQGLDDYFVCFDEEHPAPEQYQRAITAAEGQIGIVQMQSLGKAEQRKGINYQDILTQHWLSITERVGLKVQFYLPGSLSFWQVPEMVDQMQDMNMQPPTSGCLRANYDQVAKRNGFHYDADSGLFLR
ncbi:MAG TPA: hypothetical protein VJI15_01605 [Candidatus Nanoarchaeia archaeon]|nr:hypothetical protein [Candidatus Nanoarchaeia archaeon]